MKHIDDMLCALGDFAFRVVVAGFVEPVISSGGSHAGTINEVGVYVRDSFDFEGYHPLGVWNPVDKSAGVLDAGEHGVKVENKDFRIWRERHGRGGDFLVFSDVLLIPITPPVTFIV